MGTRPRISRWREAAAIAVIASAGAGSALHAQANTSLPFAVGERLTYEARAGRVLSGRAEMWIEGPVDVRGASTFVLRFSFNTKVGPVSVSDETASWLDPVRMAALRFEKRERHFLARHEESIEIDGVSGHWRAADGREGDSQSTAPLDELSFIYALRTLALSPDSAVTLERHFDADRNPTVVRLVGNDTVVTPAGTFATRDVEMRVRDARHYRGEGVIRLSFSDDPCRRPVRIESNIPGAGHVVLTLAEAAPEIAACAPLPPGLAAR